MNRFHKTKSRLVFLQLPQVDNDIAITNAHENIHLAECYLRHSIQRAGLSRHFHLIPVPVSVEQLDQHHALEYLVQQQPDIVAATFYLWNIERSLALLAALRRRLPAVHVIIGGPEVSRGHPFLFRYNRSFDIAVEGEGEVIFPQLLSEYLAGKQHTDFSNVYRRCNGKWVKGYSPPPYVDLQSALPPACSFTWVPDSSGIAYLEISRGCPMHCSYCRYPHLRARMNFLPPDELYKRVAVYRHRNVHEIRFIDPTFNAHPQFTEILQSLAVLNKDHQVRFFAEIKADSLSAEVAHLLSMANFAEVEVGMQSRDLNVLSAIHRPTRLSKLDDGVRQMTSRGIRVTLDVMYGLPKQKAKDVYGSLQQSLHRRRISVQCLQTLVLPGTELYKRKREWGLVANTLPPYGIVSTPTLSSKEMVRIESFIARHPKLKADMPTRRFVGCRLPDLFAEKETVDLSTAGKDTRGHGTHLRRALMIKYPYAFFDQRMQIVSLIQCSIAKEPFMLWQFVLALEHEEPLDLLDLLIDTIRAYPSHIIDRYASCALTHRIASRRIFLKLSKTAKFRRSWIHSAEQLLRASFF